MKELKKIDILGEKMSKKVLTIQDISCYGSCSTTVALALLPSFGFETVILPSAILSTHTSGFKNFTVLDLTSEMPKIVNHWRSEGIRFDAIYTGYIGDARQFDIILDIKKNMLNDGGIFFCDPAMADYGKLYPALDLSIVDGMKRLAKEADILIPNITEASFLTDTPYKDDFSEEEIEVMARKLLALGSKAVIISGVKDEKMIGAKYFDNKMVCSYYQNKREKSYHGTGDLFSSIVLAYILKNEKMPKVLEKSTEFIVKAIDNTIGDETHNYAPKYEEILKDYIK